jgi:hypothetical protein
LPCALGKGNARHSLLSCVICDARQRKGVDGRPRGDGVTSSLPCAAEHAQERWHSLPCATWHGARQRMVKAHGLPRARRTAKIGPWRTVDYSLCRASCLYARQRLVQAPGAPIPLPCVWWRGARQRMVNVPCAALDARQRDYSGSRFGSICRAPTPRRTAN